MKSRITLTMSSLVVTLLLAGFPSTGAAQDEVKRPPLRVPEAANTALQLVPPGWRAEKELPKEVDLNGDGRPDAAFVISHGGTGGPGDDPVVVVKHVLELALRGSDGELHRSIVSDDAVLAGNKGGECHDRFESLAIETGEEA